MSHSNKELKTLAVWEAIKGLVALMVGLGLHQLTEPKVQKVLEDLFMHLHLNPGTHLVKMTQHDATFISDHNVTLVLVGSVVYAMIRWLEAYGLWNGLTWIQWFALLSGAVYLPFELYEMLAHFNALTLVIFIINLAIVGYLFVFLRANRGKQ